MLSNKLFGKEKNVLLNRQQKQPATDFYSLSALQSNGKKIAFENFRGKKVLIINTASECGYTPQYEDLEKLHKQYGHNCVLLAFPANDFGEQEPGTDESIASFCKINYGISFPLMKKSTVLKSATQHPVFKWLSDKNENGWCNQGPTWNFCKYLIDEKGVLQGFFPAGVAPLKLSRLIQ